MFRMSCATECVAVKRHGDGGNRQWPISATSIAEVIRQVILEGLLVGGFTGGLLGQAVGGQFFQVLVGGVATLAGQEVVAMGQGLIHGELEEALIAAFQLCQNSRRRGGVRVIDFFLLVSQASA